jgi:ABC-type branched-subunit amino acid transport system substrate-binding protein
LPLKTTPASVPDWAPFVAQEVAEGAGCIIIATGTPQDVLSVATAAAQNPSHPLVANAGLNFTTAQLKSAGSAANGLLMANAVPSPAVPTSELDAYHKTIATYAPGTPTDVNGVKTWAAFHALQQITRDMTTITRQSIMDKLNSSTHVDPGFGAPAIDFTAKPYNPEQPRITSGTFFTMVYDNGHLSLDSKVGPQGIVDVAPVFK